MKLYLSLQLMLTALLLLIDKTQSIFISIPPNSKECVLRPVFVGKPFAGKYHLAGENEKKNSVRVYDENNNSLWLQQHAKSSDFKIKVNKDQHYTLCFENLDSKFLTVTFDFFEDEDLNNLVSAQNISELNSNVHDLRKRVDIIHSDMRNSAVRRNVHMESKILFQKKN